ncbi:MAG: NADH-quinone oxidoreductase subunit NuoK [Bacteroidetes bacterium CG02_land_8_20_14_3_00_31_25]|nr:NADH-quinone oxidoreductase subunit NuoK [Bacteroidota bacterium]PIV58519.1 MAG: NADH-quinone oxidoreductase subunit NuoK [Bacteroidetes bacterium CG02_land_8_20_14_3_00_31_25]PIX32593.1 MAG: NADH-quinone oxidoreductase subunit NuoK [Bacteroidetes bacterium CG_4_8_14_3_um_filter_31_14]PIY02055.1 MAG: NADH-quinone oxidoreductase subunit NuoK [Bacteroidetes bacterium CG_4_10_14_3_um_filter_31_20]
MIHEIPIQYFLIVSTIMFFVGVCGFIIRRNLITILMSVELILNAININFLVFNRYLFPHQLQGNFFALIVVAVAAAEASVAIALFINMYRRFNNIDVENISEMKY